MTIKTLKYIPFLLLVVLVSCNKASKNTSTYFGGKIINPKSKYVILYSMDRVIDTLYLDKKNTFFGKIDSAKEGLYYFQHGPENQNIYLEPKDSLIVRLNTWDFDESLVFTGIGAERNNILIDCFLEDEKDEKIFYKLNKLQPQKFKQKVDSLTLLKLKTFNDYVVNHPEETEGFKNILRIALTYPTYSRIEAYPIAHVVKMGLNNFPKINDSFYDFRTNITINNDSLMYYYPYSKYIRNYLYNATYSIGHKPMMKEFSSEFTVDLLKTINNTIKSKETKDAFLKQTTITHFYRKSSCDINKTAFETFFKLSTNNEDKKVVQNLLNDNKALEKGTLLNNFSIKDLNNTNQLIHKVLNKKNSFIFFWNPEYASKNYIASRINYLSSKFPEIQFIQIKIDGTYKDRIKKLDIKNQYFIDNSSKANLFLSSKMPRSILVNKKGIITNGYASLSSRNVINQLKELEEN